MVTASIYAGYRDVSLTGASSEERESQLEQILFWEILTKHAKPRGGPY